MTNPDVTFEAVERVSNALVAEGLRPTVRAVRERLGGSNSTLVRHLRSWNEARDTVQRQPRDLPGELVLAVRRALAEAEQASRAEAVMQLEATQQTVDELLQENGALERRLEAMELDLSQVRTERDGQKGKLEQAAEERTMMAGELLGERQRSMAAQADLAKARVRVELSEATLAELRERENALRQDLARASTEALELRALLAAEQVSKAGIAAQLASEQASLVASEARVQELARLQDGQAGLASRAAAAEAALVELRSVVETLRSLVRQPEPAEQEATGGSGASARVAGKTARTK